MKTKDQKNDRMFRMFLPFQSTSWIATGVSIVITGIILFVISRCSPYTNDADKPIYKNFWLAFGAFFGQRMLCLLIYSLCFVQQRTWLYKITYKRVTVDQYSNSKKMVPWTCKRKFTQFRNMFNCQSCVRKQVFSILLENYFSMYRRSIIYMIKAILNFNSFDINNFVSKIILSTIQ